MSNYGKFFSWRGAILKSNLEPTTRHVLLTLACHMNDAGESCYPTISTLCSETGLSKQTIITHLDLARDAGWVVISKHGFKGQRWANNDYRISWPDMEGGQGDLPPLMEGSQPGSIKVVNLAAEGSQPGSIKVVKEVDSSTPSNTPTVLQVTHQEIKSKTIQEIFSYWQQKTKHPGAILDAKRKTAFTRALKLGYSIEQLRSAVDGCLKSPWHQGDNDEGKVYDAITLIFRNAEKIEQFIGYNKSPPKPRHEEWKPGRPIYINGVRVPDHQCDEQTGWVSPEFGRSP